MDITPIQGHAALVASIVSVVIIMSVLFYNLRTEKDRPTDHSDDHH